MNEYMRAYFRNPMCVWDVSILDGGYNYLYISRVPLSSKNSNLAENFDLCLRVAVTAPPATAARPRGWQLPRGPT